ncbi:MAG TPA: DUF4365 domain-containing protein [Gemmataceae bacterium]|nr:DUF4365 domain-containing protein [Gemmataceae bacterium]
MMTRNHRQEALCRAYVQAVAALAGVGTGNYAFDYGVDMSLRVIQQQDNVHQDARVQLDLQLRSTTRANVTDTQVSYDLDVRTYEYLRQRSWIHCILVLLILPEDEGQWLSQSPEELTIRHCAYWISLEGAEPTTATSSIRIAIPRTQIFSVQIVRAMMNRLVQGEEP